MMKTKQLRVLCLILAAALLLVGCGQKTPRTPVGVMDSPEHHFRNGLRLLDEAQALAAAQEFDLALSVDHNHGPSMAGKAVSAAMRGDRDSALDYLDSADDAVDEAPVAAQVWVKALEIRTHGKLYAAGLSSREDMLETVDEVFEDGIELDPEAPALYFYRAEAYVQALEFGPAEGMYHKVLELKRGFEVPASKRWQLVQDVNRVSPGTVAGRRIALVKRLTRADMAALLVEELPLDKFYVRTSGAQDEGFVTPSQVQMQAALDVADAVSDIQGHPLATDIQKALNYGVKGLDLFPDRTFRPDTAMTRAEAALIFADVIVRSTGKSELATMYIGEQGRLPDLRSDHPAYNAAVLCLTRGIMEADLRNGGFRPLDTISGIEALLAIKELREELSLF